jgi:GntR family transcriptional regulator
MMGIATSGRAVDVNMNPSRPRYAEVAADLIAAIEAGRYDLGDDLPSEARLCAEYQVSRFTVREALRRVEETGLITRRQGSGSRVIALAREARYALTRRSDTDLLRYTEQTRLELTSSPRTPSSARARTLGLGDPKNWVHVSGIRLVPGARPIGFVDIFVLQELEPVLVEISGTLDNALFRRLLEHCHLTLAHVDEVVSATSLPARAAKLLDTSPGGEALQIIRRFSSQESGLFEVSVNLHPAERFDYALRFDRMPNAGS